MWYRKRRNYQVGEGCGNACGWSARFALKPSRPFRSGWRNNLITDASDGEEVGAGIELMLYIAECKK